MYRYTFSEEDTAKLAKKVTSITDQFKEIDNKYESMKPDFSKQEFVKPTEDEILNTAESSLAAYKDSNISKIEDNYSTKTEKIHNEKENLIESSENTKENIANKTAISKQKAENSAIKNGLARSSIIINQIEAFDEDMITTYNQIDEEIKKSFTKLDNQKTLLEQQRTSALNAFDIAYAVKLNDKLNDINEKILAQEEKVNKYNREIEKKEQEYLNNKTDKYETEKQQEKYEIAKEYYLSMPTEQAAAEIRGNSALWSELGNYYNKLKNLINSL